MIIVFFIMALIFVRQIMIYKEPLKINYAPILIALGAIGTVTHILSNPTNDNFIFIFRESLLPLFVSFILFIIIYIMAQNQVREFEKEHLSRDSFMLEEFSYIKEYISALEKRIILSAQNMGSSNDDDIRQIFEKDIDGLNKIQNNQSVFLAKFEQIMEQQQKYVKQFEEFSKSDFLELDQVMHRHIETVRQDQMFHFKKIEEMEHLQPKEVATTSEFNPEALNGVKEDISKLSNSMDKYSKNVMHEITKGLRDTLGEFEGQFSILRTHARGMVTNIKDSEGVMNDIRSENGKLLTKIAYTTSHLEEVEKRSRELEKMYDPISSIMQSANDVKNEYIRALKNVHTLSDKLNDVDIEHYEAIQSNIDALSLKLSQQLESSLKEMQEHFHIVRNSTPPTMQELSQKGVQTTPSQIKVQQAYTQE